MHGKTGKMKMIHPECDTNSFDYLICPVIYIHIFFYKRKKRERKWARGSGSFPGRVLPGGDGRDCFSYLPGRPAPDRGIRQTRLPSL